VIKDNFWKIPSWVYRKYGIIGCISVGGQSEVFNLFFGVENPMEAMLSLQQAVELSQKIAAQIGPVLAEFGLTLDGSITGSRGEDGVRFSVRAVRQGLVDEWLKRDGFEIGQTFTCRRHEYTISRAKRARGGNYWVLATRADGSEYRAHPKDVRLLMDTPAPTDSVATDAVAEPVPVSSTPPVTVMAPQATGVSQTVLAE